MPTIIIIIIIIVIIIITIIIIIIVVIVIVIIIVIIVIIISRGPALAAQGAARSPRPGLPACGWTEASARGGRGGRTTRRAGPRARGGTPPWSTG